MAKGFDITSLFGDAAAVSKSDTDRTVKMIDIDQLQANEKTFTRSAKRILTISRAALRFPAFSTRRASARRTAINTALSPGIADAKRCGSWSRRGARICAWFPVSSAARRARKWRNWN